MPPTFCAHQHHASFRAKEAIRTYPATPSPERNNSIMDPAPHGEDPNRCPNCPARISTMPLPVFRWKGPRTYLLHTLKKALRHAAEPITAQTPLPPKKDRALPGPLLTLKNAPDQAYFPKMASAPLKYTDEISYSTLPLGMSTRTSSPSSLPSRARATGARMEMLPLTKSVSSGPRMV